MVTITNYNGEAEVLFKPWTVRTYYILKRNGLKPQNEADCILIGNEILSRHVRNAGLRMACELYRAGGLGVYTIFGIMDGRLSLERIKQECNFYDRLHHEAI